MAALVHANAHLRIHLCTGDGSPLRWSPLGAAIFCTSTCHLDHAHENETRTSTSALLHAVLSLSLSHFLSIPSFFSFPGMSSYDNSAPTDTLTLLVESSLQFPSKALRNLAPAVKLAKGNTSIQSFSQLERQTEADNTESHMWRIPI